MYGCFAYLSMCTCVYLVQQSSEEGIGFPGTRMKVVWEPPCRCWEKPGPLGEQQIRLAAELSLQSISLYLNGTKKKVLYWYLTLNKCGVLKKDVLKVPSISVRICICEASLHIYINSHLPNYTERENLIESFYNHIIYSIWLHLLMMQCGKRMIVAMNDNVVFSLFGVLMFFSYPVYGCMALPVWRTVYLQCFLGYARAASSRMALAVPLERGPQVSQTLWRGGLYSTDRGISSVVDPWPVL